MKNIFLTLITCLCLIISPAWAQSSTSVQQAQANFSTQYKPLGLIGCNSNPDHGLLFAAGTSQANINTVTAAAATYDWTGASIVTPDILGFFTAIATDLNLPAAARTQLPLAEPLMVQQINNPTLINNYISDMVTSGAYPWLSLPAIQELLAVAAHYNIPISAPTVPTGTPNLTGFKLAMIQDNTIPITAKLHLFQQSASLTDLIGYSSNYNPSIPLIGVVAAGQNLVLPVASINASVAPGVFAEIQDSVHKEVVQILAVDPIGLTITVSGTGHNYGTTATITACNLLQDTWLAIAFTDPLVNQVTCTDGVNLVDKVQALSHANGIDLTPLTVTPPTDSLRKFIVIPVQKLQASKRL